MKQPLFSSRYLSVCVSLLFSYALLISTLAPFTPQTVYARSASRNKSDSQTSASSQKNARRPTMLATSGGTSAYFAQNGQPSARAGEVLVRFRANASEQSKSVVATARGAQRRKLRGESGIEKLNAPSGRSPESLALDLMQEPSVELAEPNFLIAKDDVGPSDPKFGEQWALRNTGQAGGQFGSDINVTTAWQTTTGSQSTVIAVIDSGIDFGHPDLVSNRWTNSAPGSDGDLHGWDYITGNGTIRDEQGHGTAIAGIIAAQGNNSIGLSGVMWQASLMSLRVLDNTGTGDIADAVEAIDYAVAHGAQVVNISWGTSGESTILKDALERAIRRGVVVVCSAGNSGQDVDRTPYYPVSFNIRELIAVASSDKFDQLSPWSNRGRRRVTVAAPGTDILTTQMGGGYLAVTGTSASAPLVSGVAGLLKSYRPGAGPADIRSAITNGARQVTSLVGQVSSGGVVDAGRTLDALQINPYRGNGSGGGNNGNGNGQGNTPSNVPAGQRQDDSGRRANGREGLRVPKPAEVQGVPGDNLPNLNQLRSVQPTQPKARTPIQSNSLGCGDCGHTGGGSGYYPPGDSRFGTARTLPRNETGQENVDLGSRNFNWSVPLVGLPGRTGLDLDFTLSYNSLVWTKDGSYIKFNADLGTPAPGFRLGFPTLQQRFYNSETTLYAFMLVTPSGGRVEMRQIGSTSVYESADGSFTQATDYGSSAVVKTADGTQLTFVPTADVATLGYRCTQIQDRNGNYISATYNLTNGHLLTATDTLGRVISFVYNGDNNLEAIRQIWAGGAHDWATFSYGQVWVAPSFGGSLLVNGPNGSYATVLTQVSLHDGSYFTFAYNSAFAQVNRINHYAPDNHLMAYTSYNVSSSTGQTDCPRFTEQRDWAENWNNGAEALTSFSVDPGGGWTQETTPDQTIYKEFYATSGWQTGLTTSTEIWSGGVKKKWTSMIWTNTVWNYKKNPRVIEVNTYDDASNRRRVTLEYASYNLPNVVREWTGSAGTDLYRTTTTSYRLDTEYVNRRIIGLVDNVQITDGAGALVSKNSYGYDWGGSDMFVDTPSPAVQHDRTNFGPGLVYGRGNMSQTARWDVNDPQNLNDTVVETKWRFNSTGSILMIRDHLWHSVYVSYNDSFSAGGDRNTFAYPTTVTDADGFQSLTKYNFDYGAITWRQTPSPNSGQTAPTVSFTYDSIGRPQQITNDVNNAYTRWVYPTSNTILQTFTTIVSGAGEAYSVQLLDGAGRVRASATDHPGSVGLYSGQYIIYDNMGRMAQQSNPTEMAGNWAATGDDTLWRYTVEAYDSKGRPNQITNTDGTAKTFTYGGCGCAGGEVTTAQDEHGRQRRLTTDTLGRLAKVEELNWGGSVYATTNYSYNALDQITQSNQAGQPRSFEYDGHGRLWRKTTPEQGAMTYSYNRDDTVNVVADARGATTTFGYNARRLVTGITFGVPSGVAATNQVGFSYDAAGNRTNMTTWYVGNVSYQYDQLSRMTSETRLFDNVGYFTLNYQYNLAGELTSITNPWTAQVGYSYDKLGRPTGVTGSGYAGVSNYASALTYRAFGAIKGMSYGNGRTLSTAYDNRLRATQLNVANVLGYNYNYDYFNEHTGRMTYAQNIQDPTLDRSYEYDHLGRLAISHSGAEARAHAINGQWGTTDGPYSQGYDYDPWGNVTHKYGWGGEVQGGSPSSSTDITYNYTNNQRNGFSYDPAGNLTNDLGQTFTYDATGQQATASYGGYLLQQVYDGDGLRVKKVENGATTLYLRSTVLGGQVVAEMNGSGGWTRGFVYLGAQLLAVQQNASVSWIHEDPITKSKRVTNSAGTVVSTIETDPWGADTNRSNNTAFQPRKFTSYDRDSNGTDEAMFRRYNRWQSRFDQPDPYNGSYDFSDPQSFNRYAYVQGDPVNFVDPSGLCTFNITITSNVLPGSQEQIQSAIRVIFFLAGQSVVFGNPQAADGGSYGVDISVEFPPEIDSLAGPDDIGVTPGIDFPANHGYVSTRRVRGAIRSRQRGPLAVAIGRTVAHESAHHFLRTFEHSAGGLMTEEAGSDLGSARAFGNYLFTSEQARQLSNLCPIENINTEVPGTTLTLRPMIGGGGHGGGGLGGGGGGGNLRVGGMGLLSWLYWWLPRPHKKEDPSKFA